MMRRTRVVLRFILEPGHFGYSRQGVLETRGLAVGKPVDLSLREA